MKFDTMIVDESNVNINTLSFDTYEITSSVREDIYFLNSMNSIFMKDGENSEIFDELNQVWTKLGLVLPKSWIC